MCSGGNQSELRTDALSSTVWIKENWWKIIHILYFYGNVCLAMQSISTTVLCVNSKNFSFAFTNLEYA